MNVDAINVVFNVGTAIATLALIGGLALWAYRYRNDRRAVVRSVDQLRQHEEPVVDRFRRHGDSMDLSLALLEVRARMAKERESEGRCDDRFIAGYLTEMKNRPPDDEGRPPLRAV